MAYVPSWLFGSRLKKLIGKSSRVNANNVSTWPEWCNSDVNQLSSKQARNQSINQSFNQSINQSVSQSVSQIEIKFQNDGHWTFQDCLFFFPVSRFVTDEDYEEITVRLGHYVELKCCSSSFTKIKWYKEEGKRWDPIQPVPAHFNPLAPTFSEEGQVLVIKSASESDEGNYKCVLEKDGRDVDKRMMSLTVAGMPIFRVSYDFQISWIGKNVNAIWMELNSFYVLWLNLCLFFMYVHCVLFIHTEL